MAITSGLRFGVQLVAGAALAAGLGLGGYFIYQAVSDPVAQKLPIMPVSKTVSDPVSDTASKSVPELLQTPDTSSPTTAQPLQLPTFDVVRIEADGASVIAGNAPAAAVVSILLNGAEVGKATADANGKFVALLTLPTSAEAQVLSLSVQDAAGQLVSSQDQVIVAPTTKPAMVAQANVETAKTSPGIAAVTTAVSAVGQSQEATEMAREDATKTSVAQREEPQKSAPAVLLANAQGVRVLQPASSNPSVINNVAIDAISYDAQGDVQLSGRGLGDGFVRIYLDDTPVQTTRIDDNGGWQTALPNVDTGIYTLRVDQIDAAGDVTSRVQTPFKREAAQALNEALKTAKINGNAASITAVTVQPGSTLWAIARDTYGDGALYVRVFEANSANIRNPDLIYPGQVFSVPK